MKQIIKTNTTFTLLIFFLIYFILQNNLFAQDCTDFFQSDFCEIPYSKNYKKYGKSKGIYAVIKRPYKYEVVLKHQKDYKIAVCVLPEYEPAIFKIIDKESGIVMYDNTEESDINSVGFSVEDKPINIIIEVTIVPKKFKPKDSFELITCLGVQILYKNIPKTGFD